ncbi:carboxy-cis,cis-muconate cyclase [Rhexocercosporidium sp. MPI-PUGE-AT-0058]|nr:carboxy-cis,cis-muconate cyclase [Rhexocercosporidium sp. MPI-PUGE-AT-0058]
MRRSTLIFSLHLLAIQLVSAKVHHLFVGNLGLPASIHALEFDDEALTLVKTRNITADSSHAWIAFDHQKQNVYGASLSAKRISSYSVHPNATLRLDASLHATGACLDQTSAFVLPSSHPPYFAYTGSWAGPNGCGMAISTRTNGTLSNVTQSWKYLNKSAIHGLAFGPQDKLLYSADLSADRVWTHSIGEDGMVSLVGKLDLPKAGMHPRHLAAHPDGKYLYVLMEHENTIVEYGLDKETGAPAKELKTYSLLPEGKKSSGYWSAEVMLSHSNRLLWASARANRDTDYVGYISCFSLAEDGKIKELLFIQPTTTTGGIANQVSPSPFSDDWMALSDFPRGYVEIWQVRNLREGEGVTARPVAKVEIGDGGCCANSIWYD